MASGLSIKLLVASLLLLMTTTLPGCVALLFGENKTSQQKPHIVFILADDLGWNDVGWHNPDMLTPNLDHLAKNGIILNSSYVQPLCSPSRGALMSGYYPIHTGLQNGWLEVTTALDPRFKSLRCLPREKCSSIWGKIINLIAGLHGVIYSQQATCLPLNLKLLPQHLKEAGYSTHMAGKWHLGYCNWKCTPTFRGFDTFVGFYNGAEGYYHHRKVSKLATGYDFRFNTSVYTAANGTYSANIISQRATDILSSHDPKGNPLYLYLAFQNVHLPLQVPRHYADLYPNVQNKNRKIYCGMVSALDEAVGNITKALKKYGFMKNTLLVFTTDNGGSTIHAANNLPLRGSKHTLWEGGTKGAAFVYGPGILKRSNVIHTGMIHAVDWYPTLLHVAGGKLNSGVDGVNQWESIVKGGPSARNEFIYNIDPLDNNGAIRVGDYKLIEGNPGKSDWTPVPTFDDGEGVIDYDDEEDDEYLFDEDTTDDGLHRRHQNYAHNYTYRLFNIRVDPTEHHNLAAKHPNIVKRLKARLQVYKSTMVPPNFPKDSPKADPKNYNGFWGPGWC